MTTITYYHILGVSSDATEDEIAAAFRRKVKQWHPDVSSHPDAEERMREINEAAEVLCDPGRRMRYDRALAGKTPFMSVTAPKQRADGKSLNLWRRFSRAHGRAPAPFKFNKETVRFAATGCAALLVLAVLLIAALPAFPLLAGPISQPAAAAVQVPGAAPTPAVQGVSQVLEEGNERIASGDYKGALRAYDAVIADNPGSAGRDLWYNRGIAQNALGLYPEAAESFDRVLQIDPEDSFALGQKGAALLGLGQYEESLRYTDKALTGNSDIAWIWTNRGRALQSLGQQKEARAAFENAGVITNNAFAGDAYHAVVIPGGRPAGF